MGTKNDPPREAFWSKVGFLSKRIVNLLALFVPSRWTERANKRRMILESKTDSESSLSLLCNVSWRGGYMPRKTEASYLWVEGMRKTDSRFPVREIMRRAKKEKKSMPNQTKGSREIKTYVSSGTKTEMPMEAEDRT